MNDFFKYPEEEEGELKKEGRNYILQLANEKYHLHREMPEAAHGISLDEYAPVFIQHYRIRNGKVIGLEIQLLTDEQAILFEVDESILHAEQVKPHQKTNTKAMGNRSNKSNQGKQTKESQEARVRINKNRLERPAFAPYNFIPLNEKVARIKPGGDHATFDPSLMSGYLEVTLTNKTPFFIRKQKEEPAFFSMNKEFPFVPGSSLRGMVRNLVEIVSWSELGEGFFSNLKLSHRGMADQANRLQSEYKKEIGYNCQSERDLEGIKAGYLRFDESKRTHYIVKAGSPGRYKTDKSELPPDPSGRGYRIFSGTIPKKTSQWLVNAPQEGSSLEISESALKAYRDDSTRKAKVDNKQLDLLEEAKNYMEKKPGGYPVFYNTAKDNDRLVSSFGHTPFYRIPYSLSVGDHIRQTCLGSGEDLKDFATAIFGSTEMAGRVWFCDLKVKEQYIWPSEVRTRKLLGPKPTTFQHYLEQPDGINTKLKDLRHWGDGSPESPVLIRGFKQYWHRVTPFESDQKNHWGATEEEIKEANGEMGGKGEGTVQQPLRPLQPGSTFQGRIYFDNLSEIELGALLFVLDLPEGCCHKLGLGKPLGLGSVALKVELTTIDRQQRYQKLFAQGMDQWNTGERPEGDLEQFKTAFQEEMARQLELKDGNLWENPRLRHLKAMLAFEDLIVKSERWLEETRYMEIQRVGNGTPPPKANEKANEYKDRPVLPDPQNVRDKFMQRQGGNQNEK